MYIYMYIYIYVYVCVCVLSRFSHVWLCVILWTAACQAPLSMGSSRKEHWSGLPCPPPGDHPDPGTEPVSLTFPALAGRFSTANTTWETQHMYACTCKCMWVHACVSIFIQMYTHVCTSPSHTHIHSRQTPQCPQWSYWFSHPCVINPLPSCVGWTLDSLWMNRIWQKGRLSLLRAGYKKTVTSVWGTFSLFFWPTLR